MKKYPSNKMLAVLATACVCALIAGLIFKIANISFPYTWELIFGGGFFGMIFVPVFFAQRSRYLRIDEEKVVFPRGCTRNEKLVFQRTAVRFDEIRSVKSEFHKGESEFMSIVWGLFGMTAAGDSYSYILTLKDDTQIKVSCLYEYGKKAEKEIFEMICQSIEKYGGRVYKDPNGE